MQLYMLLHSRRDTLKQCCELVRPKKMTLPCFSHVLAGGNYCHPILILQVGSPLKVGGPLLGEPQSKSVALYK